MSIDATHDSALVMLRQSARDFAQQEIAPLAQALDSQNAFPRPLWQKMGKVGLLGITINEEYGGSNLGYLAHCIAMEEISRASAAVGLSYGAHSNLCANQIQLHGTAIQKKQFLPALVSGTKVGALAMSEDHAGSDVVSMKLQAKKDGEDYILNGGKMWITNGYDADVVVVYASTAPDKKQHGITAFIVEGERDGFSRGNKIDKLGMRGSDTCPLTFRDCRIPANNILGELNGGVKVLMGGLDYERAILAAGPLGIMAACLSLSLEYATQRKQFGQPIADFQLIRAKLADMQVALSSSRAFVYSVAQHCDCNRTVRADCAGAILLAAENATRCALETVQILGGNGYTNDYAAGRLLRDAKLYEIGAGTSEIRRMLIARELLEKGIAAPH